MMRTLLEPLWSIQANLFWLYMASAAIVAVAVHFFLRRDGEAPSRPGLLAFLFPATIYDHASTKLDFRYFIFNLLIGVALVAPALLLSQLVARSTVGALVDVFGIPDAPVSTGVIVTIAATALLAVAGDLGFFISHWLQHRVPLLWEFHKAHHSAEALHPFAAFRAHPVDQVLDAALITAMTGFVTGLWAYGADMDATPITVLGANVFAFVFNIAGASLRHSHIRLSFGPLNRILVSPAMHQMHHDADHIGKNFGGMLSIWDRMIGTFHDPHGRELLAFGLPDGEHREYSSILRLLFLPLRKAALTLVGRSRKPSGGNVTG